MKIKKIVFLLELVFYHNLFCFGYLIKLALIEVCIEQVAKICVCVLDIVCLL